MFIAIFFLVLLAAASGAAAGALGSRLERRHLLEELADGAQGTD